MNARLITGKILLLIVLTTHSSVGHLSAYRPMGRLLRDRHRSSKSLELLDGAGVFSSVHLRDFYGKALEDCDRRNQGKTLKHSRSSK